MMFVYLVPLLLFFISLLLIFLLIRRKWYLVIFTIFVIIVLNITYKSCPLNFSSSKTEDIDLSLFCLNIHSGGKYLKENSTTPDELVELLLSKDADILILLEYDTLLCRQLSLQLQKEYRYFDYIYELSHIGPNAIFSKYPLSNRKVVRFDGRRNTGLKSVLETTKGRGIGLSRLILEETVKVKDKDVRLVSCHLESNHIDITNGEYEELSFFSRLSLHISNIARSIKVRELEALEIATNVNPFFLCDMPIIVCGDMNSLTGSATISILEKCGLYDAWWEGGFGYGATIHRFFPFRIDYIFYNDMFKLLDIEVIDSKQMSDHRGLYATFGFR